MRILVVSTWFPYPPNNGSRIRAFNLLRALSQRHEVSLLSFAAADSAPDVAGLDGIARVVGIVQAPVYQPSSVRSVAGLLSPLPRNIVDTYSRQMDSMVQEMVGKGDQDVAVAFEVGAARYVAEVRRVPSVFEEIETGVIRDQYLRTPPGPARARYWLTWQKTSRYTARLARRFSACTVASQQERAILELIAPGLRTVSVIPNGVDTDLMQPGMLEPAPCSLIYNGALTYSANYDAMQYFLAEIWPHIRAEEPGSSLAITGSTEGVDLSRLPHADGVTLTGYLSDIRPAVAGAWACVVPLRIGGGTRLKILEAMALGTPVVATSKGAEGLAVTPEENILLADDPRQFAAQTIRLMRDPALRQRLSAAGRRLVETTYSWQMIGETFMRLVESVAARKGAQ